MATYPQASSRHALPLSLGSLGLPFGRQLSWMHKHMSIVPAVVVLMFSFEDKKNAEADVIQQLESLKCALCCSSPSLAHISRQAPDSGAVDQIFDGCGTEERI